MIGIGFYTCQNKKEDSFVCTPLPHTKAEITFSLTGQKIKKEGNTWFVNAETLPNTPYPPYHVGLFSGEQMLKKVIHTFKSEIGIQESDVVYGITLYCDKGLEKGVVIKPEDAKAISLYLLQSKKIYHHFFLKKGNQFEQQPKYSKLTAGMILTTQDRLLNKIVLEGNVDKCYINLTGKVFDNSFTSEVPTRL